MKSPDPVPTVDKCGEEKLDIATQRCTEVYICLQLHNTYLGLPTNKRQY